jgi:hypothetical protein
MILFFYLLAFIFVWSEFFHIYNKQRLDVNFKKKDIQSIRKIDIVFYLSRFLFITWMIVGLWTQLYIVFAVLLGLTLIKFPIYHTDKKLFAVWDNLLPLVNIIVLLFLVFLHLFI